MPDPWRKRRPGEGAKLSHQALNSMLDAGEAARTRREYDSGPAGVEWDPTRCSVQNGSGYFALRYGVLGIEGMLTTASQDFDTFSARQRYTGRAPLVYDYIQAGDPGPVGADKTWLGTAIAPFTSYRRHSDNASWDTVQTQDYVYDDAQNFCILLDPAPNGEIVRAITSGDVPARLRVNSLSDRVAGPISGDTRRLGTGTGAAIVNRQSVPACTSVTDAADNGGGLIRLTATHDYHTGDVVRVYGMETAALASANGDWTVTVPDGTHLDLQGSTWPGGAYPSPGSPSGTVILVSTAVAGVSNSAGLVNVNSVGHHLASNDWVEFDQLGEFQITRVDADNYTLQGLAWTDSLVVTDSHGDAVTSGGEVVTVGVDAIFPLLATLSTKVLWAIMRLGNGPAIVASGCDINGVEVFTYG